MSRYVVVLKPSAVRDLDRLRRVDAKAVMEVMEACLLDEPAKTSKSRIKKLKGLIRPDYRLRAGDYRVFYTIREARRQVEVLRIMHKDETHRYYEEFAP
jgi:mRNA-degrading endonuclease RelE of RelBE toxin-antitoxin system